jgi:two-component system chemotaxis response regulator CheB
MPGSTIRVLVVDDSSFMRKVISDILSSDSRIEVIGTARDGEDACDKVASLRPDVVTLDVEMPKRDGLATLEYLMRTTPVPVIMVSSLTQEGAQVTLKALSAGAVDFIAKPSGHISLNMRDVTADLISKVVAASTAKIGPIRRVEARPQTYVTPPREQQPRVTAQRGRPVMVAIAASTGGPRALQHVLSQLPTTFPVPIVVVQHMPKDFTKSFANRLDSISALRIIEGAESVDLQPGMAVIAPGGYHMLVRRRTSGEYYCALSDMPPLLSVKPSANILFLSVADEVGGNVVGVILTGMGRDGTDGAVALHGKGAHIIAESQETCVVFGMPKAASEAGVVDELLPLHEIPEAIMRAVRG